MLAMAVVMAKIVSAPWSAVLIKWTKSKRRMQLSLG
jgi:hypothetical protein